MAATFEIAHEVADLRAKLRDANETIASQRQAIGRVAIERDEAKAHAERLAGAAAELEAFRADVTEIDAQRAEQLDSLHKAWCSACTERDEAKATARQLVRERDAALVAETEAISRRNTALADRDTARAERGHVYNMRMIAEQERDAALVECRATHSSWIAIGEQRDAANARCKALSADVAALAEQRDAARLEITKLVERIDDIAGALSNASDGLGSARGYIGHAAALAREAT
jgi:chromosome segregation ATPase